MFDFHNHILPNVDDGSTSLEMSLEMLHNAQNQGVTNVVNTVHYQHPKVDGSNISYKTIKSELNALQEELKNENINIQLHCGAEVFFLPNILELKDEPLCTFSHGKYMLIEFEMHQLPDINFEKLFELKMNGVTPIIAHPERYKDVQKNLSIVESWLKAGCIIQVDAGSVLGKLGKMARITSEKVIRNNWCQILGSDSHDNSRRAFCLKDALEIVSQWVGPNEAKKMVNENPKAIIEGKPITFDFEYEPIKEPNIFYKIFNSIRNK